MLDHGGAVHVEHVLVLEPLHGLRQPIDALIAEQQPGLAGNDRVTRAAAIIGNHGPTRGHGLQRDDAKVFLTGENERPAPREVIAQDIERGPAKDRDRWSGQRAQVVGLLLRPADHDERQLELVEGLDGKVWALVRREFPGPEVEIPPLGRRDGRKAVHIDRRVHDG